MLHLASQLCDPLEQLLIQLALISVVESDFFIDFAAS